jgi:hypothetical protein
MRRYEKMTKELVNSLHHFHKNESASMKRLMTQALGSIINVDEDVYMTSGTMKGIRGNILSNSRSL